MQTSRLPLIPEAVLKAHKVDEPGDTRFRAAARLLQALWRAEKGLPIGSYRTADGRYRRLGSRISRASARTGANFLSPDIAQLTRYELVYREEGAMIDQERLWANLLSSQPLCFNLFGALKLTREAANSFFRALFPDYVAEIRDIWFEHSPGRGDATFTDDHTAFDVFVPCLTVTGHRGFVALEVKYSESMGEPPATLRPRYDELSADPGLFKDPSAAALRETPLQQLWREHLLSRVMVANGLYDSGRFVVMHPAQNGHCAAAVRVFQRHLSSAEPSESGFQAVLLEDCVTVLEQVGQASLAADLRTRYLDFDRVEKAIFTA